jgi:hypothetical protein
MPGTTLRIVKVGTGVNANSLEQSLPLPARPAAPSGVAGTITTGGLSNGTLTAVTGAMEYRLSSSGTWTAVTGGATTVTGLSAGTYHVRLRATSTAFASAAATVIVGATPVVTSVTVTGAGGATTITTAGGTLQMSAAVEPAGAVQTVTWSVINGTGRATINAAGLLTAVADGTVTVRATAAGNVRGELVITISGQRHTLTVVGGSGSGVYPAGTSVRITAATPSLGREFDRWIVSGDGTVANAIGSTTTFTMPAGDATVTARYREMSTKPAWDAAAALIEGLTFTIAQREGNTAADIRYPLAARINDLIRSTGFTVTHHDIVVFYFSAAVAADAETSVGTNGAFGFRVTPPNLSSAYADGIITASPFDPTSNDVVARSAFKAWHNDGRLHVAGLTVGQPWQLYSLSGVLLHHAVAIAPEADIRLPERGVYIVRSGNETVIVAY